MNPSELDLLASIGMSQSSAEELIEILLAFMRKALRDQPTNVRAYALSYFENLDEKRKQQESGPKDEDYDDFGLPADFHQDRRASIIPLIYNIEDESVFAANRKIYPKSEGEIEELKRNLLESYIFKLVPEHEIIIIIDCFYPKYVRKNEFIIKQGDKGDSFYVVSYGTYEAFVDKQILRTYTDSGSFGELALLYNQPRFASVRACTDGKLWVIAGDSFRQTIRQAAHQTRTLYTGFLNNVALFDQLNETEKYDLADALTLVSYKDGQCILKQGQSADCMYFVKEGSVRINMDKYGILKTVKICRSGDYFGELALLVNKPRAASAYAIGDVILARLEVDTFERLLGKCNNVLKRNARQYEDVIKSMFGDNLSSFNPR